MNIIFRADANQNIGMGHIMRCLSIADAFTSIGNSVCFVLADDAVQSLVQGRGYDTIVLNSDYQKMENELKLWSPITPDLIIIDSYFVTAEYFTQLRDKMKSTDSKLVYIDDVLAFPYPVDILVDYNAYSVPSIYNALYDGVEMPSLILGPRYAPLRSMFRGITRRVQSEKVKNILISTGGSDKLHLTLAIFHGLIDSDSSVKSDRVYHFLLGAMNADKEEIKKVASEDDHIVIHENVSDMRSLIESMDLAISAAGSTLYEISACGVSLITFSLADNQIPGAEAFENLGLAVNIGDLRDPESIDSDLVMSGTLDESAVERILSAIEELSNNYELRVTMGKQMQEMIDGFGADRMVAEILRLMKYPLTQ